MRQQLSTRDAGEGRDEINAGAQRTKSTRIYQTGLNLLFPAIGRFHSSHMPQGCRLRILILKPILAFLLFYFILFIFFACWLFGDKEEIGSHQLLDSSHINFSEGQTPADLEGPNFSETLLSPVFQQGRRAAFVCWGNYLCPRTQHLKDRSSWPKYHS